MNLQLVLTLCVSLDPNRTAPLEVKGRDKGLLNPPRHSPSYSILKIVE